MDVQVQIHSAYKEKRNPKFSSKISSPSEMVVPQRYKKVINRSSKDESEHKLGEYADAFVESFVLSSANFGSVNRCDFTLVSNFLRKKKKLMVENMRYHRLRVADYCFVDDEDFSEM